MARIGYSGRMSVAEVTMDARPEHILAMQLQRVWMRVSHFFDLDDAGVGAEPNLIFLPSMEEQLRKNSQEVLPKTPTDVRKVTTAFTSAMANETDPVEFEYRRLQVDQYLKGLATLRQSRQDRQPATEISANL